MKKILIAIFTYSFFIGSYVYYDTKKVEEQQISAELNDNYIVFYETILEDRSLQDKRRFAYKESYRTFLLYTSDEYVNSDPRAYEGLID